MNKPTFQIEQQGTTITVLPQIATVTSQQLRELNHDLKPRLTQGEATHVLFDMTKVEYLDSSCVANLISLLQSAKQVEGKVLLAHCQPNVVFLLNMSKLDEVFDMYDSMDEAINNLRDSA